MKMLFMMLFALPLCSLVNAQQITIPEGIIYHFAKDSINEKSKKIIQESINRKNSDLVFNRSIILGPNLWTNLILNKIIDSTSGINLNYKIPLAGKIIIRKGRIIKSTYEFNKIWAFLLKKFTPNYNIRKLTKQEISYYWSIISYEIEEPVFIVENNEHRLLINLDSDDLKIFFIESL